jgi:hypothetical protein
MVVVVAAVVAEENNSKVGDHIPATAAVRLLVLVAEEAVAAVDAAEVLGDLVDRVIMVQEAVAVAEIMDSSAGHQQQQKAEVVVQVEGPATYQIMWAVMWTMTMLPVTLEAVTVVVVALDEEALLEVAAAFMVLDVVVVVVKLAEDLKEEEEGGEVVVPRLGEAVVILNEAVVPRWGEAVVFRTEEVGPRRREEREEVAAFRTVEEGIMEDEVEGMDEDAVDEEVGVAKNFHFAT